MASTLTVPSWEGAGHPSEGNIHPVKKENKQRESWGPHITKSPTKIEKIVFLEILLMEEILYQLRLVVYPIIYKVLYIPGGAEFLPSTVCFMLCIPQGLLVFQGAMFIKEVLILIVHVKLQDSILNFMSYTGKNTSKADSRWTWSLQ